MMLWVNRMGLLIGLLTQLAYAQTGAIRGKVQSESPVLQAWAIQRILHKGKMDFVQTAASLEGDHLVISNLAVPGEYDLKFKTAEGYLEGWDARVKPSDYVEEQPLNEEMKQAIYQRIAHEAFTGYDDEFVILDIQGNIHHASILVRQLRQRAFVSGGYRPGEWTWRVSRYWFQNPEEDRWVPDPESPFFAYVRERIFPKEYAQRNITYARHLGGISLTEKEPAVDLGIIQLPRVASGVNAVNPQGRLTEPIWIKGGPSGEGQTESAP